MLSVGPCPLVSLYGVDTRCKHLHQHLTVFGFRFGNICHLSELSSKMRSARQLDTDEILMLEVQAVIGAAGSKAKTFSTSGPPNSATEIAFIILSVHSESLELL